MLVVMVPVPESKLQANTLHCHNPARGNSHALERGAASAAGRTPQPRSVEAIGPRPRTRGSTAHPRTRCRRGATGEAACPALVGLCGASSQQSRHHTTQLHFASVGASKTSAKNGVASRKRAPGKACRACRNTHWSHGKDGGAGGLHGLVNPQHHSGARKGTCRLRSLVGKLVCSCAHPPN